MPSAAIRRRCACQVMFTLRLAVHCKCAAIVCQIVFKAPTYL